MLRKPDSIPAGDTVITDPVMEPFFIAKSQSGGYTVYERVVKGNNDTEYIKTVSYPATFNGALKRVANEKLNNGESKVYDLKSYITRWEAINESISNLTPIKL